MNDAHRQIVRVGKLREDVVIPLERMRNEIIGQNTRETIIDALYETARKEDAIFDKVMMKYDDIQIKGAGFEPLEEAYVEFKEDNRKGEITTDERANQHKQAILDALTKIIDAYNAYIETIIPPQDVEMAMGGRKRRHGKKTRKTRKSKRKAQSRRKHF